MGHFARKWLHYICVNLDTHKLAHNWSVTLYQFPYVTSTLKICHAVQVTFVSMSTKIIVVRIKCEILGQFNFYIVTRYQLPVTSYQLHVTSFLLPVTSYLLPVTCYQLPVTSYQHFRPGGKVVMFLRLFHTCFELVWCRSLEYRKSKRKKNRRTL